MPELWLFTRSSVECQIHGISPPNLVGGHKYPSPGGDGSLLASASSLHMLGNSEMKGSWGETIGKIYVVKALSVVCFLSGVELFIPFPVLFKAHSSESPKSSLLVILAHSLISYLKDSCKI